MIPEVRRYMKFPVIVNLNAGGNGSATARIRTGLRWEFDFLSCRKAAGAGSIFVHAGEDANGALLASLTAPGVVAYPGRHPLLDGEIIFIEVVGGTANAQYVIWLGGWGYFPEDETGVDVKDAEYGEFDLDYVDLGSQQ